MNSKTDSSKRERLGAWTAGLAMAVLGATQVLADGSGTGTECSNRTLRGDYGIQMQGTRPTPPPNVVTESVVGVVLRSFDGYGNFTQLDNIKGSVTGIVPDRPGSGTYEVFPDCTGTASFAPDPNNPALVIQEKFIILDKGAEIRSITQSPPPLMITAVAKRVR
jgi:hypothetical protein